MGANQRASRQKKREVHDKALNRWVYLLEEVDEHGTLSPDAVAAVEGARVGRVSTHVGAMEAPEGGHHTRKSQRRKSHVDDIDLSQPHRESLKRHSLVTAPLRGDNAGKKEGQVHQVVFTDEKDGGARKDGDILRAMYEELCRHKPQLLSAFADAESDVEAKGGAGGGPVAVSRAKSTQNELPYDAWIEVLCQVFPVYSALWREFGPKLAGGAMQAVQYRRWLDRYQVQLKFDKYQEFERSVLQQIGARLGAKTQAMTINELLQYFDPDRNGMVDSQELLAILEGLELGLSKTQLRQLIYELGFNKSSLEVNTVEVMVMLLKRLPLSPEQQAANPPSAKVEQQMEDLRNAVRKNMASGKQAFNQKLLTLFKAADTDANGFLSHDECGNIMKQLQETCKVAVSAASDMNALVQYIDGDNSGSVTFLEFVAALGLVEDVASTRDLEETSASLSESGLSLLIMQQICTALYQLDHSLQKAFIRIDQRGEGWLEPDKFARALQLVASIPGSDRRAIDDWQITALTDALKGSNLSDAQGRIDYAAFVRAFYVIDTHER